MHARTILIAISLVMAGCATEDVAEAPDAEETAVVEGVVADLKRADPDIQRFFDTAYGYVIFPSVGEGGLVVGGARGTGWVYQRGKLVGEAKMTQLSVGAQAGGQSYAEIIFFRDSTSLNAFKAGKTELGAEVSAVVLKQRAAKTAGYDPSGLAIFVLPKGGAMAAAAVGGQKFSFEPLETT
jgi:lipid-binding SYLF domain-containing protein